MITRGRLAKVSTHTAGAILLLGLAACGSEADPDQANSSKETVTITDSQDRKVDVPIEPEVVVATDWSVIRTLSDLGVKVDAAPASTGALPKDLTAYEDVPAVGDVFEPDYEAISAMEPDLVIVGSRSGTPEVVAEFEKFAPAVIDMSVRAEDPAEVWAETRERVTQLGEVFAVEDEATAKMDGLEQQLTDVREQVKAADRTAMFVQVSEGTVGAYGASSRFGTIYQDFGYQPTDAPVDEEGSHGEEISQEFFVKYNPGVIFVLDRSKAIGQKDTPALDVLDNGLVARTDAAKDDKLVEVDGFSWYLAASAPSSLQRMIDDVEASL